MIQTTPSFEVDEVLENSGPPRMASFLVCLKQSALHDPWEDWKIPAEDASYVEDRGASAYQTSVVRAVTDNVALRTQNRVSQSHRV